MAHFETTVDSIFGVERRLAKKIEARLNRAKSLDEVFGTFDYAEKLGYPQSWINRDFGAKVWSKAEEFEA